MPVENSEGDVPKSEWVRQSVTVSLVRSVVGRGQTVVERLLLGSSRTLARWADTSRVYGSLTAEPPEWLIVVNLADARTLRPFFEVLFTAADTFTRFWTESAVCRLGRKIRDGVGKIAHSSGWSLLRSHLTPPDRPDD